MEDPGVFIHLAFKVHLVANPHSFISVHSWVGFPVKPGGHLQSNDPGLFMQVAPFPQGAVQLKFNKSGL